MGKLDELINHWSRARAGERDETWMTDRKAACGEEGMVVPYQELGSFCCCLFRIILAASTVVVETQVLPQLRIVALRENWFFCFFFWRATFSGMAWELSSADFFNRWTARVDWVGFSSVLDRYCGKSKDAPWSGAKLSEIICACPIRFLTFCAICLLG